MTPNYQKTAYELGQKEENKSLNSYVLKCGDEMCDSEECLLVNEFIKMTDNKPNRFLKTYKEYMAGSECQFISHQTILENLALYYHDRSRQAGINIVEDYLNEFERVCEGQGKPIDIRSEFTPDGRKNLYVWHNKPWMAGMNNNELGNMLIDIIEGVIPKDILKDKVDQLVILNPNPNP